MSDPLLVYAVGSTPLGETPNFTLDLAWGRTENNFALTLTDPNLRLDKRMWVYLDGTPWGGIIDAIEPSKTGSTRSIQYEGRTFSGVLAGKILSPDPHQDYLTVSGSPATILNSLLKRCGLSQVFTVGTCATTTINSYQFNRYTDLWSGLLDLAAANGLTITFQCQDNRIYICIVKQRHFGDTIDDDVLDFTIKDKTPINHLICGGKGELASREVIHLYADRKGNISDQKSIFAEEEQTQFYDDNNAEGEELRANGTKKLKELQNVDTLDVTLHANNDMSVGDIAVGFDPITGITISQIVAKQIVKISHNTLTVNIEVGNKTTATSSTPIK